MDELLERVGGALMDNMLMQTTEIIHEPMFRRLPSYSIP